MRAFPKFHVAILCAALLALFLLPPLTTKQAVASRLFTAASSEYGEFGTAAVTAYPVTFCAWFKANTITGDHTLIAVTDTAGTNNLWQLLIISTGAVRAREANSATPQSATTTGTTSTGVWTHGCATFVSSTSRAAFINGAKTTNATSQGLPAGLDVTTVGRRTTSSPAHYFDGLIAEAVIWSVQLTDNEILSLAHGAHPYSVRPVSIAAYWPMYTSGGGVDLSGNARTLTFTGTSTSDHAPAARKP